MSRQGPAAVTLVTGGTRGICLEVARGLARFGGTVLVAARDEDRGEAAVRSLLDAGAADARFLQADLSRQREVRDLAARVLDGWPRLDLLVNGAATVQGHRVLTEDGVEATTAVNLLAPFLLTLELAPRLQASSPSRVVNVTSAAQGRARLDLGALQDPGELYEWEGAYARSKLALTVLTAEQAARLRPSDVTANAVHPGFIPGTDLARGMPVWARWGWAALRYVPLLGRVSVAEGAATVLKVASGDLGAEVTGRYFAEGLPQEPPRQARDPSVRDILWRWCARATGVNPEGILPSVHDGG